MVAKDPRARVRAHLKEALKEARRAISVRQKPTKKMLETRRYLIRLENPDRKLTKLQVEEELHREFLEAIKRNEELIRSYVEADILLENGFGQQALLLLREEQTVRWHEMESLRDLSPALITKESIDRIEEKYERLHALADDLEQWVEEQKPPSIH